MARHKEMDECHHGRNAHRLFNLYVEGLAQLILNVYLLVYGRPM